MSHASSESRWVDRELDLAEEVGKPILPLLVSGRCFLRLRDRQYEDVTSGQLPSPTFVRKLRGPTPPAVAEPVTRTFPDAATAQQRPPSAPTQPLPAPAPAPAPPVSFGHLPPMAAAPVSPPAGPAPLARAPARRPAQPANQGPRYVPPPPGTPIPVVTPTGYGPGTASPPKPNRSSIYGAISIACTVLSVFCVVSVIAGFVLAALSLRDSKTHRTSPTLAYIGLTLAPIFAVLDIALIIAVSNMGV